MGDAREDLTMLLQHWGAGRSAALSGLLGAFEAEVREDALREAAEEIRNSPELRDFTDDHMGDCNAAADLIDPDKGD